MCPGMSLQTWVRTGNLELAGFCFFIRPIRGGIGRQPPINTSVYGMAVLTSGESVKLEGLGRGRTAAGRRGQTTFGGPDG